MHCHYYCASLCFICLTIQNTFCIIFSEWLQCVCDNIIMSQFCIHLYKKLYWSVHILFIYIFLTRIQFQVSLIFIPLSVHSDLFYRIITIYLELITDVKQIFSSNVKYHVSLDSVWHCDDNATILKGINLGLKFQKFACMKFLYA